MDNQRFHFYGNRPGKMNTETLSKLENDLRSMQDRPIISNYGKATINKWRHFWCEHRLFLYYDFETFLSA